MDTQTPFWIYAAWWAGAASWFVTYILIIYVSWRDRTYGMPMLAIVIKLAAAFLHVFIYKGDDLYDAVNIVWFSLDLVILSMFVRFWRSDFPETLGPYMWPTLLGCAAMTTALMLGIIERFGKDYGGVYISYGGYLMTSALFLVMLVRRGNTLGQSVWIGVFKMLGAAGVSISNYLYEPGDAALNVLCVEVLLLDALYVWLLMRAPRWQRPPGETP